MAIATEWSFNHSWMQPWGGSSGVAATGEGGLLWLSQGSSLMQEPF